MERKLVQRHFKEWGGTLVGLQPSRWRAEGKRAGWFVYSLYAAESRLRVPVYVGMTGNLYNRLSQHRRLQEWWPLVGQIVVEHFDDKGDAEHAENRRIFHLRPLFNIYGNPHMPRMEECIDG